MFSKMAYAEPLFRQKMHELGGKRGPKISVACPPRQTTKFRFLIGLIGAGSAIRLPLRSGSYKRSPLLPGESKNTGTSLAGEAPPPLPSSSSLRSCDPAAGARHGPPGQVGEGLPHDSRRRRRAPLRGESGSGSDEVSRRYNIYPGIVGHHSSLCDFSN